jgi:hypothetical protein
MKKKLKIFGWILLIVLIGIQFVPAERTNPQIEDEVEWDASETRELAQRACFDCHSNETEWPWYSYIAPISWRVTEHVRHGREHLNFSEWNRPNEDLEEIKEMVEEGKMPLWDYLLMHSDAKLSDEEKAALLRGLAKTFESDPPIERRPEGQ